MIETKSNKWPTSDMEAINYALGAKMHLLSTGTATAQDISEATRLIRERASYMMPGVFSRLPRSQRPRKRG
jgi:hypothetical protein